MITNFTTLNEPIIQALAFNKFTEIPSMIPTLFGVVQSKKRKETYQAEEGGTGFQQFTGTVAIDNYTEGYTKEIENVEFASSFQILRSALADDQYNVLKGRSSELGRLARYTREEYGMTDIFDYAFSTTKCTGFDSLSLCSSAHTSPVAGVANQSNSGTATLSYANVLTTRTAMKKFTNNSGRKIFVNPDTLLTCIDKEGTAYEIAESMFQSSNLQNSFVANKMNLKVYCSNFLTDLYAWFLIDSSLAKDFLIWQNREPFSVMTDESLNTLAINTVGYYRCARGFTDWRWVYGQNATS